MPELYFDEIINVISYDRQGVNDEVFRVIANGEEEDCYLELDLNLKIYPMFVGAKYKMLISDSMVMTDSEGKQETLMDKFEHVMYGRISKMFEAKEKKVDEDDESYDVKEVVYIKFGGEIQVMLKVDPLKFDKFKVDQQLFLYLRKM